MLGKYIAPCENSLTASVIPHLLHLPVELFWQILRSACYDPSQFPANPGEPLQIDYWPKWNPTGTLNNTYVEPDVFIRFREFDIIIEAKGGDEGGQDPKQWQRELIAYTNVYGIERLPVRMIALGGIHGTSTEMVPPHIWRNAESADETHEFVCPVVMCRWTGLLDQCKRMESELRRTKYQSSQTNAHRRNLLDLMDLFARRGFQTGTWFSEVTRRLPQLGSAVSLQHRPFHHLSSHLKLS